MKEGNLKDELKPFYEKGDCCSWIVELRKDKYQLQQENKQLKEELEKKHKKYLIDSKCINDKEEAISMFQSIIKDLEEWLKQEIENIKNNYSQINGNYFNMNYKIETYEDTLDKIQKLKEKYK